MSLESGLLFVTDTQIPSSRASAIHIKNLLPALKQRGFNVQLLSNAGKTESWPEFARKIDHTVIHLPTIKGGLFWMLCLFSSKLKKLKFDVIYSRFVLLPLIARKRPYVLELHDDAWNKGFLFRYALRKAQGQKNCLGFVVITRAIKSDLKEAYPGISKRIEVIEDAAASPNENYKPKFLDKRSLDIAYVGSFHKGKGVEVVLEVAEKLPEHNFIIVGGGAEDLSEYEKGSLKNVHFKGYVEHDQIWELMDGIDICMLPNQPNVRTGKKSDIGKYTSPLKMFEYMSFSKPTIASDLSVLKEVLDDQIAIFAKHDSVDSWISAISKLSLVDRRSEIGKSAFERFKNNYTWEKRAERILTFINEELNTI